MASTFYKLFTIEIEMLMPYAVEKVIHGGHPLINNFWLKQERKPQGTVGNPPNYIVEFKNTTVG